MKPTVHCRTASIAETPTGWVWREQDRKFKTATAAWKAVKADGKLLAGKGNICGYIIAWHPTSLAGRIVAQALAASL